MQCLSEYHSCSDSPTARIAVRLPGIPASLTQCTAGNLPTHIYIYILENQITTSVWLGKLVDGELQRTFVGRRVQFELPE